MSGNENEKEREIKRCLKTCYKEDKRIMFDESMLRIKGITLYIYDLIYFGNKIIISSSMVAKAKVGKGRVTYKIYSDNCKYLLQSIDTDTYDDYNIVDMSKYGDSEIKRLIGFLKENPDVIYFLTNARIYNILLKEGLKNAIKFFELNTTIHAICRKQDIKYDTLGFVYREDGKMYFKTRTKDVVIKAFTDSGIEKSEKEGKPVQISVGDIILTRNNRETKYTFNLYKIVSNHTRHFAVHIIWTDIAKGENTNFYVKRLEEMYQRIISNNA